VILVHQSPHRVVASEEKIVEPVRRPEGFFLADRNTDPMRGKVVSPRFIQAHPPPGCLSKEPLERRVVVRSSSCEIGGDRWSFMPIECLHDLSGMNQRIEVIPQDQIFHLPLGLEICQRRHAAVGNSFKFMGRHDRSAAA
jgi:hypothetical protein